MRSSLLLAAILGCAASAAADEKYVTIRGQVKWNGEKAPGVELVDFIPTAIKGEKATMELDAIKLQFYVPPTVPK